MRGLGGGERTGVLERERKDKVPPENEEGALVIRKGGGGGEDLGFWGGKEGPVKRI